MRKDNSTQLSESTKKRMADFFMRTSVPRILAKEKELLLMKEQSKGA